MPEVEPKPNLPEHKPFWSTVPGLLTAVGGVVTAVATLLTALVAAGVISREKPTPTVVASAPVPTATAIVAPATIAAGYRDRPAGHCDRRTGACCTSVRRTGGRHPHPRVGSSICRRLQRYAQRLGGVGRV